MERGPSSNRNIPRLSSGVSEHLLVDEMMLGDGRWLGWAWRDELAGWGDKNFRPSHVFFFEIADRVALLIEGALRAGPVLEWDGRGNGGRS